MITAKALTFREQFSYFPARHGLREVITRHCQQCPPDVNYARYTGVSDDQVTPCPCCKRTEDDGKAPTCHHDGLYVDVASFAMR